MPGSSYIPVIDLSPCWSDDSGEVDQCSRDIVKAFSEVGFVYLTNHRVPQNQLENVLKISQQFFALPSKSKESYRRPDDDSNHGWVTLNRESLNPERPGDYKESYNVTPATAKLWPEDLVPGFEETMMTLYQSCTVLTHTVLGLMGRGLGLEDPDLFVKGHNFSRHESMTTLRSLYYPPLPDNFELKPGQVRCGEHSDYGSITLLFQDDVGGLEVRARSGEYVAATPIKDTVLVNIGDLMQRWTEDKLSSTKHRVLIPETEKAKRDVRQSVAFFAHPDDDFIVKCISGSDLYEPISALDYLKMRFQATY